MLLYCKIIIHRELAPVGTYHVLKGMAEGATRQVTLDNVDNAVKAGMFWSAANATVPLAQIVSKIGNDVVVTVGKESMARIISTVPSGLPNAAIMGINTVSGAILGGGLQEEAKAVVAIGGMSTASTGFGIASSIDLLALKVGFFFGMAPTP